MPFTNINFNFLNEKMRLTNFNCLFINILTYVFIFLFVLFIEFKIFERRLAAVEIFSQQHSSQQSAEGVRENVSKTI